jgi:hypothetical protein
MNGIKGKDSQRDAPSYKHCRAESKFLFVIAVITDLLSIEKTLFPRPPLTAAGGIGTGDGRVISLS